MMLELELELLGSMMCLLHLIYIWGRHAVCTILFYLYMYIYKNFSHRLTIEKLSHFLSFFLVTKRASYGFISLQMPTRWPDATSWPFVATQPLQSPQQGRRSLPIITGSEQRGFWLPSSCWPECLSHLLHRSKVYLIYSCCLKPPRCSVDADEACRTQPWRSTHIPELKHVFRVDAEVLHFGLRGEKREERGEGELQAVWWRKVWPVNAKWDLLRLWKGPQSALQQQRSVKRWRKRRRGLSNGTHQQAAAVGWSGKLTSLACSRNQALADSALVMVSWVVKVFQWQN